MKERTVWITFGGYLTAKEHAKLFELISNASIVDVINYVIANHNIFKVLGAIIQKAENYPSKSWQAMIPHLKSAIEAYKKVSGE